MRHNDVTTCHTIAPGGCVPLPMRVVLSIGGPFFYKGNESAQDQSNTKSHESFQFAKQPQENEILKVSN